MEPTRDPHSGPFDEFVSLEILLERFERGAVGPEGYEPVSLITNRGDIHTRYYAPVGTAAGGGASGASTPGASTPGAGMDEGTPALHSGVVFVGGAGGGFESPARSELYPRLGRDLSGEGVACLQISHRRPREFQECVLDVLAALAFLDEQDVGPVALVGHDLGGPVAIHTALLSPAVLTCVALATRPEGAEEAEYLGPRCSIFLVHGADDEEVPAEVARRVYEVASEPKRLELREGVGHDLAEWGPELTGLLRGWIRLELGRPWAG